MSTENDIQLIVAIATDIMGWVKPEDPDALHNDPTTRIHVMNGRTIKGETYFVKFAPEETPYSTQWYNWNPLVNPTDWMEVTAKLISQGHRFSLEGSPNGWKAQFTHPDFPKRPTIYHSNLAGAAVCMAALMFHEDLKRLAGSLTPKEKLLLDMKDMARAANLPAIYKRVTVDASGDCYAWPVRPVPGKTVWVGSSDEEKALGIVEIPEGVRWQDLIVELDENGATLPGAGQVNYKVR